MKSRFLEEKYVHLSFEVSLVLKAVFAAGGSLAGIGAYFVTSKLPPGHGTSSCVIGTSGARMTSSAR